MVGLHQFGTLFFMISPKCNISIFVLKKNQICDKIKRGKFSRINLKSKIYIPVEAMVAMLTQKTNRQSF